MGEWKSIYITDFSGGTNTETALNKIASNQGDLMQNVMLDGVIRLRTRYAFQQSGAPKVGATPLAAALSTGCAYLGDGWSLWGVQGNDGHLYWIRSNSTGFPSAETGWADANNDLSSTICASWMAYRHYLFVACEGKQTFVVGELYDGTYGVEEARLEVPDATFLTNTTFADSASSGNLEERTYYYRFALGYGEADELGIGFYENSTTKSHTVGAGKTAIDITIPAGDIGGTNHWNHDMARRVHIWRTYGDSPEAGPYYYVGYQDRADGTSTFLDDYGDWELGLTHEKLENGYPYDAKLIAVHGERMWQAFTRTGSEKSKPLRLMYSSIGEAMNVESLNYIEIQTDKPDEITAMVSYRGSLVVFTRFDIYLVTGNAPETFAITKAIGGAGCRSGRSVVNVKGELWFLSNRGFRAFDGSTLRNVAPIYRLTSAESNAAEDATAIYDPVENNYLCAGFWNSGVGWIVDVNTEAVFPMTDNYWSALSGTNALDGCLLVSTPYVGSGTMNESSHRMFALSSQVNYVFELSDSGRDDSHTDATGQRIGCTYNGPGLDLTARDYTKMPRRVEFFTAKGSNQTSAPTERTPAVYLDYVDLALSFSATGNRIWGLAEGDRGRIMQPRLAWGDDGVSYLEDVVIHYQYLPLRRD